MDKSELVKKFLDANLQINPSALEYFLNNESKIEIFFSKIKNQKLTSPIITKEIAEELTSSTGQQVKILHTFLKKEKETISIEDQIKEMNQKYDKISAILIKRVDLVNPISINKINEKIKNFSLIGMVREKDEEEKTILVEDKTGKILITLANDEEIFSIDEDDVAGFVIERNDNMYICQKIIWPDVPLKREFQHTTTETNCVFVPNNLNLQNLEKWLEKNKKLNPIIFSKNNINKFQNENLILDVDGITIMFIQKNLLLSLERYPEKIKDSNEIVLKILKKRFFGGKTNYLENKQIKNIFLEQVPDIVCVTGDQKTEITNYKNTTIITIDSDNEKEFCIVNLKTRESIKVNLT